MKVPYIFLLTSLLTPGICTASDDCQYYINHQIGRFIHSVESEPTGKVEIEYYFPNVSDAQEFVREQDSTSATEKPELRDVGNRMRLKYDLKLPRFALEAWFGSHYQAVCAKGGHINDWITPSEG